MPSTACCVSAHVGKIIPSAVSIQLEAALLCNGLFKIVYLDTDCWDAYPQLGVWNTDVLNKFQSFSETSGLLRLEP